MNSITHTLTPTTARGQPRAAPALITGLGVYTLGIVGVLATKDIFSTEASLVLLHLSGIASLLTFSNVTNWGKFKWSHYGGLVLGLAIFFRVWSIVDTILYGSRFAYIPRTVVIPQDVVGLLIKSEAISVIGTLLLCATWRITVGDKIEFFTLKRQSQKGRRIGIFVAAYSIAFFFETLTRIVSPDLIPLGLGRLVGTAYTLGTVSIYFIATSLPGSTRPLLLSLVLAAPLAAFRLSSGMKSELFYPLLPAAAIAWTTYSSVIVRTLFLSGVVTVLAVASNFVDYVRKETWWGNSASSGKDLLFEFVSTFDRHPLDEGYNKIFARLNMTAPRLMTTSIADERGFEPENILFPIPTTFVPRLLWPDKPILEPGGQHTNRIYRFNIPDTDAISATASGFFNELYLGWGFLALIIGSIAYGLALGLLQLHILRTDPGFSTMCLSFVLAFDAARLEEHHVVFAYTTLVMIGIFIPVGLLVLRMIGFRSH
jgi:hypothetical protein